MPIDLQPKLAPRARALRSASRRAADKWSSPSTMRVDRSDARRNADRHARSRRTSLSRRSFSSSRDPDASSFRRFANVAVTCSRSSNNFAARRARASARFRRRCSPIGCALKWLGNVQRLRNAVTRQFLALGDLERVEIAVDASRRFHRISIMPGPPAALVRSVRRRAAAARGRRAQREYLARVLEARRRHVQRAAEAAGIATRYFRLLRARVLGRRKRCQSREDDAIFRGGRRRGCARNRRDGVSHRVLELRQPISKRREHERTDCIRHRRRRSDRRARRDEQRSFLRRERRDQTRAARRRCRDDVVDQLETQA